MALDERIEQMPALAALRDELYVPGMYAFRGHEFAAEEEEKKEEAAPAPRRRGAAAGARKKKKR